MKPIEVHKADQMIWINPWFSLGYHRPPRWKAWEVGRDITRLTEAAGLEPFADPLHRHQVKAAWCSESKVAYVRRRTVHNPKAADWHQDGDQTGEDMDFSIVLWATNTPAEIEGHEIVSPQPYEVVLIRNLDVRHRRPPNAPRVRWIFRQLVRNP